MLRLKAAMILATTALMIFPAPQSGAGRWDSLGPAPIARAGACAVPLPDGRILLAGGGPPGAARATEIIDSSGTRGAVAPLTTGHARHSCALLRDGRVMVAGGSDATQVLSGAEIYDAERNEWTATSPMTMARMGHTATTMADGRILITGGENETGVLQSMEIYDPATGTFTPAGTMTVARRDHAAVLLTDGRVLIAGGANAGGSLSAMEIFAPVAGGSTALAGMRTERAGLSATLLGDGTVLLAGGTNGLTALATTERFHPATGQVTDAAPMTEARAGQLAFALPDGNVLLIGGDGAASTAERFQAATAVADALTTPASQLPVTASSQGTVIRMAPGTGSGTLDQCANGSAPAPGVIGLTCGNWVNGNLNSSRASYREGDSVPYRLRMTGMPVGVPATVVIEWDTTQSGKHALDYLTRFNASVLLADPCAGGACSGTPAQLTIPRDYGITEGGAQPLTMRDGRLAPYLAQLSLQYFTLWGGGSMSASDITTTGSYSSSSTGSIAITFTPEIENPVLSWGGHIATRVDWGESSSAVAINGSPFHTRLKSVNGSPGNQDRALSNDAAAFPATIVITKSTNTPATENAFTFTSSPALPNGPGNPTVPTFQLPYLLGGTLSYSRTFDQVYLSSTSQTFVITESSMPVNWTLQSISCSKLAGTGSVTTNPATASATINAQEGDTFACTFTNAAPVTVTMQKACVPSNDDGSFTFTINGNTSGAIGCSSSSTTSFSRTLAVGATVNVSEGGATLTNYTTTISCNNDTPPATGSTSASFTMPNASVTCTVTNTRKKQNVTLNKSCTIEGDTGSFTLGINTSTEVKSCGGSMTREAAVGSSVSVTETAAPGTDLSKYVSNISCPSVTLGGSGLNRNFTMPDAPVTCTVTNTAPVQVTMTKSCSPDTDDGKFKFTINGVDSGEIGCKTPNTTSFSQTIKVGDTVNISESGATLGNYTTSINCGTAGSASGTSLQFPMPAGIVNCTVSNTRKSFAVTLNKVCAPENDPGRFNLFIDAASEEKGCGGSVTRQAYVGKTVRVKETGAGSTDLSKYVSDIACPSVTLGGTGLDREFVMPESAVTCTVTNRRPAVSITKECKAGLTSGLAVTVASNGKVCNTGGILLTNLLLTDTQTGATSNATGAVNFSTADLAVGECRDFTSTFTPTAASTGSCAPNDSTCTLGFTDLVTITAKGGTVEVTDSKSADCKLCKP